MASPETRPIFCFRRRRLRLNVAFMGCSASLPAPEGEVKEAPGFSGIPIEYACRSVPVTVKQKIGDLGFYHGVLPNRSDKVVADSTVLMSTIQQNAALGYRSVCYIIANDLAGQVTANGLSTSKTSSGTLMLQRESSFAMEIVAHQVIVRSRLYANATDQQDLYTLLQHVGSLGFGVSFIYDAPDFNSKPGTWAKTSSHLICHRPIGVPVTPKLLQAVEANYTLKFPMRATRCGCSRARISIPHCTST